MVCSRSNVSPQFERDSGQGSRSSISLTLRAANTSVCSITLLLSPELPAFSLTNSLSFPKREVAMLSELADREIIVP